MLQLMTKHNFFIIVFFSYIIYYKILIVFLHCVSRSLNFIFGIIYLKKNYKNDDDNLFSHYSNITMKY